jgi:hypothetical protein
MTAGPLRYGIVALARSDRRLMEASLQSIAGLAAPPDAIVLAAPKLRAHQFAEVASETALPRPVRLVTSEAADALAVADGFRALAPKVDIVVFVPESVILDQNYLAGIRTIAERWQDMVGEIDLIDGAASQERTAREFSGGEKRQLRPALGRLQGLRARTLRSAVLWVRVEACGNLRFEAFPQDAEFLAFSALLDQLRRRGRTRIVASGAAVRLRPPLERRSGYDAGREIYDALGRIAERRERSDAAFEQRASYLDPRAEKRRLFVEQVLRLFASSATRSNVSTFLRGMWAARREAVATRNRVRDDIRSL